MSQFYGQFYILSHSRDRSRFFVGGNTLCKVYLYLLHMLGSGDLCVWSVHVGVHVYEMCICVHLCMCMCVGMCVHMYVYVCRYVCLSVCVFMHIYLCMYVFSISCYIHLSFCPRCMSFHILTVEKIIHT